MKIRKNTYNIAVKTYQLTGSNFKEDEVIDVLARVTNDDADFRRVQQKLLEDSSFSGLRMDSSILRKSVTSLKTKMSRTSISSSCVQRHNRDDSISFEDSGDKIEACEESLDGVSLSPPKDSGDNKIFFMLGNYEDSKVISDLDHSERLAMLNAEHKVT